MAGRLSGPETLILTGIRDRPFAAAHQQASKARTRAVPPCRLANRAWHMKACGRTVFCEISELWWTSHAYHAGEMGARGGRACGSSSVRRAPAGEPGELSRVLNSFRLCFTGPASLIVAQERGTANLQHWLQSTARRQHWPAHSAVRCGVHLHRSSFLHNPTMEHTHKTHRLYLHHSMTTGSCADGTTTCRHAAL